MYIDIETTGSKKIDSQYGCGNVSNMEDPVIGVAESKVHLYCSFAVCYAFCSVGCPEALPFAFMRLVDVLRGKHTEACPSVDAV